MKINNFLQTKTKNKAVRGLVWALIICTDNTGRSLVLTGEQVPVDWHGLHVQVTKAPIQSSDHLIASYWDISALWSMAFMEKRVDIVFCLVTFLSNRFAQFWLSIFIATCASLKGIHYSISRHFNWNNHQCCVQREKLLCDFFRDRR